MTEMCNHLPQVPLMSSRRHLLRGRRSCDVIPLVAHIAESLNASRGGIVRRRPASLEVRRCEATSKRVVSLDACNAVAFQNPLHAT